MISRLLMCSLAGSLLAVGTFQKPLIRAQGKVQEHYISDPSSVGFDIVSMVSEGASKQWLATFVSQGKTAKFRIVLDAPKPLSDKESQRLHIDSGEGRFLAVPGSDASVFLADLKKALEAKKLPRHVERVAMLPFTYVSFGNNQSQAEDGGFNADPPGHWTPMKIFIGEGEQEGELFLNLNPVIKKGQFSIKDPDYGDIVFGRLARVL